ncbi:phosphopyruvate hydratase [Conglomerata obtusa]
MKIGDVYEMIQTRQILTSRGEPTVEIDLHTSLGVFRSSCPSGASTGSKEAKAIVDKNQNEYFGKGVKKAIFHIKTLISPRITDLNEVEISDQKQIDKFLHDLDGTENKSRIGANAILPISIAFCRAGAVAVDKSVREFVANISGSKSRMPVPYFNVINGGVHSGNYLPFQEIMIAFPYNEFDKNYEKGAEFYHYLKEIIVNKYGSIAIGVGDEGGFAPPIKTLEEGLELIKEVSLKNDLSNVKVAIDCAASEFYNEGKYNLNFKIKDQAKLMTSEELSDYYMGILDKYPMVHSLEDPFAEDDYSAWTSFMIRVKDKEINIVGDDLTVTNTKYLKKAIEEKMCNTLLVKLNQVGTVYETIEAVKMARNANMKIMVSHRSGETEDVFIADFSTGIGADYFKAGAPCRGERVAKYNQLLRIHEVNSKKKKKS